MRLTMKKGLLLLLAVLNGVIIYLNYQAMSSDARQRSTDFVKTKLSLVRDLLKSPGKAVTGELGERESDQAGHKQLVWSQVEGIHKALPAYEKMRRVLSNLQDYRPRFGKAVRLLDVDGQMLATKSLASAGDKDRLVALFADVLQTNRTLRVGILGGTLSRQNVCVRKSCVYVDLVVRWLQAMLEADVEVHNAAVGMANSDYFSWCLRPHLDVDSMDIVIWELATEDYNNRDLYSRIGVTNAGWPQEELTRRILARPQPPHLLYFNFLSTANIRSRDCVNSEYFAGRELVRRYNVTSISWCTAICTRLWQHGFTPDDLVYADELLSERAHQQGALFVINFLKAILEELTQRLLTQTQHDERYLKRLIALHDEFVRNTFGQRAAVTNATAAPFEHSLDGIKPKFSHVHLRDPLCWPVSKPQYIANHSLEVSLNEGWELGYSFNENWYASTAPNQRITFGIRIPPHPQNLTATVAIAIVTCGYCGQALVWLDDHFEGAKLVSGQDKRQQFAVRELFGKLRPDSYRVTFKNMEDKPFKIGAVMANYEGP